VLESARHEPSNAVLEEIRDYRLLPIAWRNDNQVISAAEELLHGNVDVPDFDHVQVHLPFDPSDLEGGSSIWQLQFAGLAVPEILLDAYRKTGREDFWAAARDSILAWDRYDRSAWLDRGFLWNDHAVSARVRTIADFWFLYRQRPDYDPAVGRAILEFAARTGEILAKPDQFTFATNHGVMQNIGLWDLCIAFPSLPEAERYKQLAFTRLRGQMGFYIDEEGVVLEHSIGYHEYGLKLLGIALRFATLLKIQIPPDWITKYEGAREFYNEVRRPNGSLPRFGDTGGVRKDPDPPIAELDADRGAGRLLPQNEWEPDAPFRIYPVAGYGVLWDGLRNWTDTRDLAQTTVAWSYHAGHGHKHDDELSVILWAGGQDWWTNAGYWPYDNSDRPHAECWEGSNAPHLAGEPCESARTASLVSSFHSGELSVLEMVRRGPGPFLVRRQVVHVGPSIWIVIDDASGASQGELQTIWTTDSNVMVSNRPNPGQFVLSAPDQKSELRASFLGPSLMTTRVFRGSREPFAGWVVTNDGLPTATRAVMTEQPANGAWGFTVWTLAGAANKSAETSAPPRVLNWVNGRSWRVLIPLANGSTTEVSRYEDTISVHGAASGPPTLVASLVPMQDISGPLDELRSSLLVTANSYPRFRELYRYRLRATYGLLLVLALQELFFFAYKRMGGGCLVALRFASILGWLGSGMWILSSYLNTR